MFTVDYPSAIFEYERLKDNRIRAIKIFKPCVINGLKAKGGDYLVFSDTQFILTKKEFKSRYTMTKEAKRLRLQNQIKDLTKTLENLK